MKGWRERAQCLNFFQHDSPKWPSFSCLHAFYSPIHLFFSTNIYGELYMYQALGGAQNWQSPWGNISLGKGDRKCKGPGGRTGLVPLKIRQEVSMAGAESRSRKWSRRGHWGQKWKTLWGRVGTPALTQSKMGNDWSILWSDSHFERLALISGLREAG